MSSYTNGPAIFVCAISISQAPNIGCALRADGRYPVDPRHFPIAPTGQHPSARGKAQRPPPRVHSCPHRGALKGRDTTQIERCIAVLWISRRPGLKPGHPARVAWAHLKVTTVGRGERWSGFTPDLRGSPMQPPRCIAPSAEVRGVPWYPGQRCARPGLRNRGPSGRKRCWRNGPPARWAAPLQHGPEIAVRAARLRLPHPHHSTSPALSVFQTLGILGKLIAMRTPQTQVAPLAELSTRPTRAWTKQRDGRRPSHAALHSQR